MIIMTTVSRYGYTDIPSGILIKINAVSLAQWTILAGFDQDVFTTSNVTFNNVDITDATDATSITDGALNVIGGVGIRKKLFVGTTLNLTGDVVPLNAGDKIITGSTGAGGDLILRSTTDGVKGNIYIDEVTDSTTITDGALVVDGGVGIAKKVFIGDTLNLAGNIVPTNIGNKTITGSTAASGNLVLNSTTDGVKGSVLIDEATASTTTATGALVVTGGIGTAGNIYCAEVHPTNLIPSFMLSNVTLFASNYIIVQSGGSITDHTMDGGLTYSAIATDGIHEGGNRISLAVAAINTTYYLTRDPIAFKAGIYTFYLEVDGRYTSASVEHSFNGTDWVSDDAYVQEATEPILQKVRGKFSLASNGNVHFRVGIASNQLVTPPRISSIGWIVNGISAIV